MEEPPPAHLWPSLPWGAAHDGVMRLTVKSETTNGIFAVVFMVLAVGFVVWSRMASPTILALYGVNSPEICSSFSNSQPTMSPSFNGRVAFQEIARPRSVPWRRLFPDHGVCDLLESLLEDLRTEILTHGNHIQFSAGPSCVLLQG